MLKRNYGGLMNTNNFILQLLYRKPPTAEEIEYYNHIAEGFSKQIGLMGKWLESDEAKDLMYKHWEDVRDYFENSGIQDQYDNLLASNAKSCDEFMDKFYNEGARLGFKDIRRTLAYTRADEQALNFIRGVNYDYVIKVNKDLADNIKPIIFNALASGESYSKTIKALKELPLTPINGVSVDTRARMIAITERARAANTGTRQAYLDYGVQKCEIITAGDELVCDDCLDLEANNPYQVTESADLIPAHPFCRCALAPYITGSDDISDEPLTDPDCISEHMTEP